MVGRAGSSGPGERQLMGSTRAQNGDSNDTEKISSVQEALRKRVQYFIEGLVKMASPVLLVLKMNKVDLRSKGNALVRCSISPLAAAILEASIILFLWLWLCSSQLLTDRTRKIMYIPSKILVHLCGMFLMALASCVLLIISMDMKGLCLVLLVLVLYLTILSGVTSAVRSEDDDTILHEKVKCEDELERSVDFTASITVLVFVGLGRFAFEVDEKTHVDEQLAVTALVSFSICILGVYFTLCGTIPALPTTHALEVMVNENREDEDEAKAQENVRIYLEFTNALLAVTVFGVVMGIAWMIMKLWACLLFLPLTVSLLTGLYKDQTKPAPVENAAATSGTRPQPPDATSAESKAAPLELTKASFTAFLLVAIPSFGDASIDGCTSAFILLTAAALVSGLLSRLLTHRTKPPQAVIIAADVASFFAHSCLAAAVVPFALMAIRAQTVQPRSHTYAGATKATMG